MSRFQVTVKSTGMSEHGQKKRACVRGEKTAQFCPANFNVVCMLFFIRKLCCMLTIVIFRCVLLQWITVYCKEQKKCNHTSELDMSGLRTSVVVQPSINPCTSFVSSERPHPENYLDPVSNSSCCSDFF